MDDDNRDKPGGSQAILAAGLLLLPLLYVLSSGPALWIVVHTRLPAALWNIAYWPLTFARDIIPGFHEWFQRYLDLWTG